MTRLKIVSWNIWGGEKLPEIIHCLKGVNPDIIGLQEVLQEEDGTNNRARTIAEALGYTYIYETTTLLIPGISHLLEEHQIEKNMGWGNAIVSKYPILDDTVHVLSQERKRVALEATVQVEDKNLHIFSTHLVYAPVLPSHLLTAQMQSLLKVLPKDRGLVVGNFNATPESEVMQDIHRVMTDTETDPAAVTSDGKRIDYIFTTPDITTKESGVISSQASDHLPIYAVVEV